MKEGDRVAQLVLERVCHFTSLLLLLYYFNGCGWGQLLIVRSRSIPLKLWLWRNWRRVFVALVGLEVLVFNWDCFDKVYVIDMACMV